MSQVECVTDATASPYVNQYGRPIYPASDMRFVSETPTYGVANRTYAPRRVAYDVPERRVSRPHRTWVKSAAIIGGSTAAGAGIGGLVGGKKGALVGAAIGGGASTIWEATKH